MVLSRRYVEAPAVSPLPYGLLSAALVIPDTDPHTAMGVEYESTACAGAHLTIAACMPSDTDPEDLPGDLTPDDGVDLIGADGFTVYALHTCRIVGGGYTTGRDRATEKLRMGEGRAIEEQFAAVTLAAATDLTPAAGTPLDQIDGLGLLEEYAASNYAGVPVIHGARSTGTGLASRTGITREGNRLETAQGAVFAGGAGYADASKAMVDGVTPGAGERWLWVTGAVVIRQGTVEVPDPVIGLSTPKNQVDVLAQRTNVITVECLNAAVLVRESAVGG